MIPNTGLYYFLEGIAITFFIMLAAQNLWGEGRNRLRTILGFILAYWGLQYIVSLVFTSSFLSTERDWSQIINAIDMTAEATCCFLLMELCRPGWLTWRKVLLHELPFFVLGGVFIATDSVVIYYILIGYFVAYGCWIFVETLTWIPRYNKSLREHYSYEDNVNLKWLQLVLVTFFALMFVYAICAAFDTVPGDVIYTIGSIVCWSMICYFIQKQESVIDELKDSVPESAEPVEAQSVNLEELVAERFVKPQLYLDASLKLSDMAHIVGTNRTYLSRYLNDQLNTTFYDYINGMRILHASQLLRESETSIQTIADISGFKSYSTFRRTFIAKYGMTPQEYRKQH